MSDMGRYHQHHQGTSLLEQMRQVDMDYPYQHQQCRVYSN